MILQEYLDKDFNTEEYLIKEGFTFKYFSDYILIKHEEYGEFWFMPTCENDYECIDEEIFLQVDVFALRYKLWKLGAQREFS